MVCTIQIVAVCSGVGLPVRLDPSQQLLSAVMMMMMMMVMMTVVCSIHRLWRFAVGKGHHRDWIPWNSC